MSQTGPFFEWKKVNGFINVAGMLKKFDAYPVF